MRSGKRTPRSSAFGPIERAAPGQVDVVAHDHQRPGTEARVEAARGIGQDDRPRPEPMEQQHGLDDEPGVVALVHVEPTLEQHHRTAAEPPQQKPPDVAGRGGRWPAGKLVEADRHGVDEIVGQAAEPGSQDDPDFGHDRRSGHGPPPRARPGARAGRSVGSVCVGSTGFDGADMRPPLRIGGFTVEAARLRRPDGSIDTGMPITSRRALRTTRAVVRRRSRTATKRPKRPAAEPGP